MNKKIQNKLSHELGLIYKKMAKNATTNTYIDSRTVIDTNTAISRHKTSATLSEDKRIRNSIIGQRGGGAYEARASPELETPRSE